MYKVLCNNALVCDSRIEELALIDPVIELEENKAGSFSFEIPPGHPMYDAILRRKSEIQVFRDDEEEPLFCGPCIEAETDFFKRKTITCEGELTYFNDSVQRPARYQNITVRGLLEAFVNNHNAQTEEAKHFQVGIVTVTDGNDSLYCYTNMESTMECIQKDLIEDLGGIIRIRHENGVRYIDYLAESPNTNTQVIKLGKNLLDFTSNIDSSEIATAIIPLGATQETSEVEGLETRLTIKSVNNGIDYVYDQEAVNNYGLIYKTVEFDDVTTASILKTKGEKFLSDTQFENIVIEAKAIDLHMVDKTIEAFKMSDRIRVLSEPHGMNRYFRVTQQTFNLNNPASDSITLGKLEYVGLSAQTNIVASKSKTESSKAVEQAVTNASNMIAAAMGGYVVKNNDEILIMDTNDIATATKVWRWNINGLGYSKNGYAGQYALAMTMDGAIVADFITSGALSADRISGGSIRTSSFISEGTVTKYASDYTQDDVTRANQISLGLEVPTLEDLERLDTDGDGEIGIVDVMKIRYMVEGRLEKVEIPVKITINPMYSQNVIKTDGVSIGVNGGYFKNSVHEIANIKELKVMSAGSGFRKGVSGTFTTADEQTVTVTGGIITSIY